MTAPKIKTTVYSHKVIDVVSFSMLQTTDWELEELFQDLFLKMMECSENNGRVRIKVDRPHSEAEKQHRLGVVAKNDEKRKGARWYPERREREEYERLKKKFES
jgi:hypothetical protein